MKNKSLRLNSLCYRALPFLVLQSPTSATAAPLERGAMGGTLSGEGGSYQILASVAIVALITLLIVTLRQMRQSKEASRSLAESERRFRTLVEQAGDGFELIGPQGEILDLNSATCDCLGYTRAELLRMNVTDIDPLISRETFAVQFASLIDQPPVTFESVHRRKDGSTFPVEIRTTVFKLGGMHVGLSLTRDISKRRHQMAELDYTNKCFTQALNSRHHVLYRLNVTEGRYDYLSPAFEQITGHPVAEFQKNSLETLKEYFHPDDRVRIFAVLEEAFLHRTTATVNLDLEYRLRRADGEYCWLRDSTTACFDERGDLECFFGSAHDITDSKRAEKEREQFHTLFMTSDDLMCIADPHGAFLKTNPSFSEILGYCEEELVARPFIDFVHPDDREPTLAEMEQQIRSGHSLRFENRYVCKDGSVRWLSWSAVYNPQDGLTYATARDITERREAEEERNRLEQQLLHAQKLESLGVLAGGIAHDFNNILTSIIGNADLALTQIDPQSPVMENLQRIEKSAARAADLAKQMLAYSGKGRFVVEPTDLSHLVEEMKHILEVSVSKKAMVNYHLTRPLPVVDADATQIRQIVMNLVINASEALGEQAGVIDVATGSVHCDEKYLQGTWLTDIIPEGVYVFVEVADTGCGMSTETASKIFDPFFTTKFTGRGLGMAAVLGIVRGHRGTIKVDSTPGKGTTFRVLLPASDKAPEVAAPPAAEVRWHKSAGKVLLVDDEEEVRNIGCQMLQALGFTPLSAENGRQAVEVFKNTPDLALVILDLTMPQMDGEQCFRELRQLDPKVLVLMASGYSEYEVAPKFAGTGLAGFVEKPFNLSTLRKAIDGILGKSHQG
ncbi:PAS domain-containing hybrid sensor histidine kinase/response regulator [Geomonas azotofigens]|uniref:PAS domain-containing hybrid sensor histidine kinase/response regulator n=1 Tax=Geomonas azotofigens TaxID=2843196 RepID=UPI001C125667|nr:PAS domain-containing sensor histidine kinase [Geomonas azotofigens]MBU5612867.1 PAS domain S-box protein [Geomonas azotofigens]